MWAFSIVLLTLTQVFAGELKLPCAPNCPETLILAITENDTYHRASDPTVYSISQNQFDLLAPELQRHLKTSLGHISPPHYLGLRHHGDGRYTFLGQLYLGSVPKKERKMAISKWREKLLVKKVESYLNSLYYSFQNGPQCLATSYGNEKEKKKAIDPTASFDENFSKKIKGAKSARFLDSQYLEVLLEDGELITLDRRGKTLSSSNQLIETLMPFLIQKASYVNRSQVMVSNAKKNSPSVITVLTGKSRRDGRLSTFLYSPDFRKEKLAELIGTPLMKAPISCDLDGNGTLEVIFITLVDGKAQLYALNSAGQSFLKGDKDYPSIEFDFKGEWLSDLSCEHFDKDKKLDLSFFSRDKDAIYFHQYISAKLTVETTVLELPTKLIDLNNVNSIKYHDMDNDGQYELIFLAKGHLIALGIENGILVPKNDMITSFDEKKEGSPLGPLWIDLDTFGAPSKGHFPHTVVVDSKMVPHAFDPLGNKTPLLRGSDKKLPFTPQKLRHRPQNFPSELPHTIGNLGDNDLDLAIVHEETVYVRDLPFVGALDSQAIIDQNQKLLALLKKNLEKFDYQYAIWGIAKDRVTQKGVEGETIYLNSEQEQFLQKTKTAPDGLFFFGAHKPGDYFFLHSESEHYQLIGGPQKITLKASTPFSAPVVYLTPKEKSQFKGLVKDATNDKAIFDVKLSKGNTTNSQWQGKKEPELASTDKDGRFYIELGSEYVQNNKQGFVLNHPYYNPKVVSLTPGEKTVISLDPFPSKTVVFTILDENRRPIEGATLYIENIYHNIQLSYKSNQKGKIKFAHLQNETDSFTAIHPDFSVWKGTFTYDELNNQTIILTPQKKAEVSIIDKLSKNPILNANASSTYTNIDGQIISLILTPRKTYQFDYGHLTSDGIKIKAPGYIPQFFYFQELLNTPLPSIELLKGHRFDFIVKSVSGKPITSVKIDHGTDAYNLSDPEGHYLLAFKSIDPKLDIVLFALEIDHQKLPVKKEGIFTQFPANYIQRVIPKNLNHNGPNEIEFPDYDPNHPLPSDMKSQNGGYVVDPHKGPL